MSTFLLLASIVIIVFAIPMLLEAIGQGRFGTALMWWVAIVLNLFAVMVHAGLIG